MSIEGTGAMGDAAVADSIEEGLRLLAHALRANDSEPSVTESLDHLAKATRDGLAAVAESLQQVATAIREKGQV